MTRNKILGFALGPLGSAALGFVTLPLITWFYSIEDVGRISMLQVVASFSVLLFCLGLDQAYVREYHESSDTPKLLKQTLLPGLILICTIYSAIFIFNPTLISDWLYEIPSEYLALISILCFILTFVSRFLSLILRMEERAVAYSMSQLLPKALFLIFILVTVWLGFATDTYNLITAHTLSISAFFLVFAWNTRKEWIKAITSPNNWQETTFLLKFGLPLVIGGLASWGLNVMDKLFLRSMSTFSELGVYSVTMSVAGAATIFAGIFNTIWSPMIYKWVKEGKDLSRIDVIADHLLAAIYFITVLSGLFSWILPYFLPTEYAAIQYLITPCLLAPLFYTLSETTAVGIAISRKTHFSMYASVGAMLINALGNYLLVPDLGAAGAAISTAFAFWCFYIFRTEFSRRVWRSIPRIKSYSIISILLTASILNVIFMDSNIFIWGLLMFIGLFIFKPSLTLLYREGYQRYVK